MQSSLPDQLSRHWLFGRRAIQRVLRVCEAWLLDRADLVVCSAGLAEQVHRIAPRTPVREWIYPASLPSPQMAAVSRLRKQLKLAEQERVVLYAGTFERYQGLTEVIEAIPAVSARVPGTVFVLVGAEPRSAARIRRQAKRMGLNGNLRVVDRQPREQLAAYYMLADVLLAPRASGRNLPLKLFHYMSAGRPVVATGVCNWPNSLPPVPVLVTRHTSADIAVAISRVLGDSVLASELSTRALLYATENLDTSRFVEAVQEVSLATTYGRRDAERFIPEGAAEGGVKG
jgi:glycosyltransferase involved in cell wall biosynthesis